MNCGARSWEGVSTGIILVGPRGFLGDLREVMPKDLKDKAAEEIPSDLTNRPEAAAANASQCHPPPIGFRTEYVTFLSPRGGSSAGPWTDRSTRPSFRAPVPSSWPPSR
jgi:hypothetical protein